MAQKRALTLTGPAQQVQAITMLEQLNGLLQQAETLDQIVDLRSSAEAVRAWAKSASLGLQAQNRAAEIRLRAERKAGEMLSRLCLRGGNRKSNGQPDRLNLADLGITQNQSKRWQKQALIQDTAFDLYVKRSGELGEEVTAAGLLRLARQRVKGTDACDRSTANQSRATQIESLMLTTPMSIKEILALAKEGKQHLQLLSRLLDPVTKPQIESVSSAQRRAICHYLVELEGVFAGIISLAATG